LVCAPDRPSPLKQAKVDHEANHFANCHWISRDGGFVVVDDRPFCHGSATRNAPAGRRCRPGYERRVETRPGRKNRRSTRDFPENDRLRFDSASTPLAKATAQRAIAMSYAFDGDCANTVKYEEMVIGYWQTRESAEPQNAFFQQGEMANEAARVCIDAGQIDTADKYYRMGAELGLKEPEPGTHPKALWDFRLHHALGRLAARLGDATDAGKEISLARNALDSDTSVARQQGRFFPYLLGYVALYTNDLMGAFTELTKAIAIPGNDRDPFMHYLLAVTYNRLGNQEKAHALYQQAYDLATGHNPPAAFVRPQVRKKLGLAPVK
jgi:tetratricopeptide (TPR) repeat protein